MVDFRLDEDQKQIQDMFRKFGEEEFGKIARDCDEKAELPAALLKKVWELGVAVNAIPECYGGYEAGRSVVTGAIMAEELSAGDLSLALGSLSPLLVSAPLLEFGTDQQKKDLLPKFCGENFHHATAALMEPRVAFDPFDLRTTVDLDRDKLILNGKKCLVPLADTAEQILVYATSQKGGGPSSVEAILIDKGTRGLKVSERRMNMGLRPLPLFDLELKDCEVPLDRRLGGEKGVNYARLVNISRAVLAAMAVGVARASNHYAINYAKEREAFGEPIASRQTIAFMLAESAMEIDAMRLLAWRAAWRLDQKQDATRDATLARMYNAEQTMKIVDYGIQILGGHGYIREHPQELYFRNGRAFASLEGLAMA